MSTTMTAICGFLGTMAMCCLIWWLGGFDFDRRSADVAFGAVLTLVTSIVGGIFAVFLKELNKPYYMR